VAAICGAWQRDPEDERTVLNPTVIGATSGSRAFARAAEIAAVDASLAVDAVYADAREST
jgi:hypothetical protein